MQASDFLKFSAKSHNLNFAIIPFTKIRFLCYEHTDLFKLQYKINGRSPSYEVRSLKENASNKTWPTPKNLFDKKLNIISNRLKTISQQKVADIKCLLVYMPDIDKEYYKSIFQNMKFNIEIDSNVS